MAAGNGGSGGGARPTSGFVGYMPTLALCLAVLLACSMFLRTTCMEICFFFSCRLANNARSQLIVAVFRASLSKASGHRQQGVGHLTNLLATDADGIGNAVALIWSFSQWVFSICILPAVIYMMWLLLGTAAFVGAAAFILSQLLAATFSWAMRPIVRRLQECRDVRGDVMHDVVKGIGVLKAYGCEQVWVRRITAARERELIQLRNMRYLGAAVQLVVGLFSQAAPVTIFTWYVLVQGRALDASTAFTALAWVYQMQWSISALPDLFMQYMYLSPMLRRLADALVAVNGEGADGAAARPAASSLDNIVDDIGYPSSSPLSINGASINGTPVRGSAPRADAARGPSGSRSTQDRHPSDGGGVSPLVWTPATQASAPPPAGTALCLRGAVLQGAPDAPDEDGVPGSGARYRASRAYGAVDLDVRANELPSCVARSGRASRRCSRRRLARGRWWRGR